MKPRSDWFPIERNFATPSDALAHLAEEEPSVGAALRHERDASGLLRDVPEVGGVQVAGDVDDAHAVGADDAHPARPGDGLDLRLHGAGRRPPSRRIPTARMTHIRQLAGAEGAHGGQDGRRAGGSPARDRVRAGGPRIARDGGATEDRLAARVYGNDVAGKARVEEVLEPGGVRASPGCATRPARPRRAVRRAASRSTVTRGPARRPGAPGRRAVGRPPRPSSAEVLDLVHAAQRIAEALGLGLPEPRLDEGHELHAELSTQLIRIAAQPEVADLLPHGAVPESHDGPGSRLVEIGLRKEAHAGSPGRAPPGSRTAAAVKCSSRTCPRRSALAAQYVMLNFPPSPVSG